MSQADNYCKVKSELLSFWSSTFFHRDWKDYWLPREHAINAISMVDQLILATYYQLMHSSTHLAVTEWTQVPGAQKRRYHNQFVTILNDWIAMRLHIITSCNASCDTLYSFVHRF